MSLIATTALAAVIDWLGTKMPGVAFLWQVLNFVILVGMTTLIFALIFKVVPDAVVRWRDVWAGAALTGSSWLARFLLGSHLGRQADSSVSWRRGVAAPRAALGLSHRPVSPSSAPSSPQVTAKRLRLPDPSGRGNAIRMGTKPRARRKGIPR